MKNYWVIVNPVSGKGKGKLVLPLIEERWKQLGSEVVFLTTEKKGDAQAFAYRAARQGADAVICLGGDGTIREVATGLMRSGKPIPLGILPGGTVNDLARSLGIPRKLERALDIIEAGAVRRIAVGKANEDYFVSLLAAGAIPDAVRESSFRTKKKLGAWAYFLNSARYALQRKQFTVVLSAEGMKMEKSSSLVVVSLLNSVAGFDKFFPEALSNDGWLRARVFPVFGIFGAGWYSLLLKLGFIQRASKVSYHQFEQASLTLIASESIPITLDGDLGPDSPVEVQILPGALLVFARGR